MRFGKRDKRSAKAMVAMRWCDGERAQEGDRIEYFKPDYAHQPGFGTAAQEQH